MGRLRDIFYDTGKNIEVRPSPFSMCWRKILNLDPLPRLFFRWINLDPTSSAPINIGVREPTREPTYQIHWRSAPTIGDWAGMGNSLRTSEYISMAACNSIYMAWFVGHGRLAMLHLNETIIFTDQVYHRYIWIITMVIWGEEYIYIESVF